MSVITVNTPNLKELFLAKIYEEADKEDKMDMPVKYYKVCGKTRSDYLSGSLPEDKETPISGLILSGNNMCRVWIKLYEYYNGVSSKTASVLLPPFDDMDRLKFMFDAETTLLGFIDKFLEEFYDDDHFTNGCVTLFTVNLL